VNYINKQNNFGGMADIDEWFYMKDLTKHRQNALDWRRCKSNAERTRFIKNTGIR